MLAPTAPPGEFSFKVASPLGGFLNVETSTDLGVWKVAVGTGVSPGPYRDRTANLLAVGLMVASAWQVLAVDPLVSNVRAKQREGWLRVVVAVSLGDRGRSAAC